MKGYGPTGSIGIAISSPGQKPWMIKRRSRIKDTHANLLKISVNDQVSLSIHHQCSVTLITKVGSLLPLVARRPTQLINYLKSYR